MDGQTPRYALRVAVDASGGCPFGAFLESETDAKIRALILTKVEYLSHLAPEDHVRPLVDTLEGPVKEFRFGPKKGLRILYSLEQEAGELLLFGGERKEVRACSPRLIQEAKALRGAWIKGTEPIHLEIEKLRKTISRRRLGWP